MNDIRWPRLIASGLVAGLSWIVLSAAITASVGREFLHSIPSHQDGPPSLQAHFWLFLLSLLTAIWAVWLFAVLRNRFVTRKGAVFTAAFVWWVISALQSAKWIALLAMPALRPIVIALITLPAMLAVTAIGARLYERGM